MSLDANTAPWTDGIWRLVGQWEPRKFLARRGDGAFTDLDALWTSIHDEAYLERLSSLGVNLVHLPFHKGYGLEAEEESIEETRRFVTRLRARGIRAGVYIGSTFFYEVFRHPDYEDMIRKTGAERGWSGDQYFRDPWCPNSPAARDYFRTVIRTAIERIGADLLHFDHSWSGTLGQLCHCRHCLEGFRRFVRDEIPEIAAAAGYASPEHLQPPPPGRGAAFARLTETREPGAVAWLLFHAQAGVEAMRHFADYARSLDPEIQILFNGATLCGITPFSRAEHMFEKLRIGDATFIEDSLENPVGLAPDGMPVARFRACKAAWRTGCRALYYTSEKGRNNVLMTAEAAVFNRGTFGCLGMTEQANRPLPEAEAADLLRYLVEHESLFLDREPWPQAAVLRHHESELLNPFPCALSPYVVEQMLFERHTPFTLVDGRDLAEDRLDGIDLVVAPDARCLEGAELEGLERFVERGGRLLSIGCTATATRLNRFRSDWGLARLFGNAPKPAAAAAAYRETAQSDEAGTTAEPPAGDVLRGTFGRGRTLHLPGLAFRLPPRDGLTRFAGFDWYYHPFWTAPRNGDAFQRVLDELLKGDARLEADLPRAVGLELFRTSTGVQVGFVNYAHPDRSAPAGRLALRLPAGPATVRAVRWNAPGCDTELPFTESGGRLTVHTPAFPLFGVLSVETQDGNTP